MVEETVYPACAVCGRRLLAGERPSTYVTREGAEVIVCELCKPRAEAAGWMRPDEAEERRAAGGTRERKRPRGQMLGGLLSRLPSSQGTGADGPGAPLERSASAPAQEEPDLGPTPADTELEEALRNFNFSDHRRTVAGLSRTLGPPRAAALAIVTGSGVPGFRVTVAWELTWYQWEIAASENGVEVRESGKGETIGQLRAEDRAWNLMVGSDGTLHRRTSADDPRQNARR